MPLLSGNRCVAVYDVSAEGFNKEGLEKRKLDSIVDALCLLVKEKATRPLRELDENRHIGFVLEGRHYRKSIRLRLGIRASSRYKRTASEMFGCDTT
jgi:hypothetical protein